MNKKPKPRPILMKIADIHIPKQDYPKPPGTFPPNSVPYSLLKKSLKKKGMVVPVFVNADGLLLQGHYRLWAWMELGKKHVPAIIVKSEEEIVHYFD